MQALIFKSKVVQIESQRFEVAPDLTWVDISTTTPSPKVGWSYRDGVFTPPPQPQAPVKSQRELDCEAARAAIDAALADWTAAKAKDALAAIKKII